MFEYIIIDEFDTYKVDWLTAADMESAYYNDIVIIRLPDLKTIKGDDWVEIKTQKNYVHPDIKTTARKMY